MFLKYRIEHKILPINVKKSLFNNTNNSFEEIHGHQTK